MKILARAGIALLATAILILFLNVIPRPKSVQNNRFIVGKGRPLLIAHGGGNKEFPDNTLEAFYNAYSIDSGAMMETDVNMTKDGVIVLYLTHWLGLDFIYNEPVTVLQIPTKQGPMPLDRRHFINAAHKHNIAVHYWTINDEDEMRRLVNNGADGIMTDIPSLLRVVLDDY
jgi:glycerophosphoryl diester phosphodiesterase